MTGFHLDRVPRIVGGPGRLAALGEAALRRCAKGSAVLVVADPGLRATGFADSALGALRRAALEPVLFDAFRSDPSAAEVEAAAALARAASVELVVALGGGSAMDLGKAAAAIAPAGDGAEHYALCAHPLPARPLGKICVPTTAGTGSETTRTAVVTDRSGAKVWLWGDELKADEVILDPELTVGLPAGLTAATGIDALVHAIEACTNVNAFAANDLYCHHAIRLVARYLPTAVAEPGNIAAREAMQLAAAFAGIGIDNCGTAIAHNIGHALASLRPVHHGRSVGLALLATLPWSLAGDPARFAAVAAAMGQPADAGALPGAFERLLRGVGVKVSLGGEGHDDITAERLAAQMAAPENASMRRASRRPVADADLLSFARTLLAQR